MLGLNIAGNADYSPELPLRDLVRQSRAWTSNGPPLTLTPDGYPTYVVPGYAATLTVLEMPAGQDPVGDYVLQWDGNGTIALSSGAMIYSCPGKKVYRVGATGVAGNAGNVWLTLTYTDPNRVVRNVRLYQPGEEYTSGIWADSFLRRWKGVKCLRFMDLMGTNNSTQSAWADRSTLKKQSWAASVPLEALCDLANQMGVDPWFCLPHLASDDYVAQFSGLLKSYLHPKRTPYVEVGNEMWNYLFQQTRWADAQAKAAGISLPQFIGKLATRMFKVAEPIMGTRSWVRVLSGQQANPSILQAALDYQDTAAHVDAISCSYYMHLSINPAAAPAFLQQNPTTAQAVAALRATLPAAQSQIAAHQAIATKAGKRLIAYEGGQHMVGVQGAENNQPLTDLLLAANNHPDMYQLYLDWYSGWLANTSGDVCCHFSSTGEGKFGSWGLGPRPGVMSPKLQAFLFML